MDIEYTVCETKHVLIPDKVGINGKMLNCEKDEESEYHIACYRGYINDDWHLSVDIYRYDDEEDSFDVVATISEKEGPGKEVLFNRTCYSENLIDKLGDAFSSVEKRFDVKTAQTTLDDLLKKKLHELVDKL